MYGVTCGHRKPRKKSSLTERQKSDKDMDENDMGSETGKSIRR